MLSWTPTPTTALAFLHGSQVCRGLLEKSFLTEIKTPRNKQAFSQDTSMSTCDTWSSDSHLATVMEASKDRIFKLKTAQPRDVTKLMNLPILRHPGCSTCQSFIPFHLVLF